MTFGMPVSVAERQWERSPEFKSKLFLTSSYHRRLNRFFFSVFSVSESSCQSCEPCWDALIKQVRPLFEGSQQKIVDDHKVKTTNSPRLCTRLSERYGTG